MNLNPLARTPAATRYGLKFESSNQSLNGHVRQHTVTATRLPVRETPGPGSVRANSSLNSTRDNGLPESPGALDSDPERRALSTPAFQKFWHLKVRLPRLASPKPECAQ